MDLKKILTALQYSVTQENATEPPFNNLYWQEFSPGVYVDVISKVPLFLSSFKFDAGCGWPSFFMPIKADEIVYREDLTGGRVRVEIRSKSSDSHLGHVFDDGPLPTGLRYCLNSASLEFIPIEKVEGELKDYCEKRIKAKSEFITLAAGCFWGVQYYLSKIEGVLETIVGYTQGSTSFPSYEDICSGKTHHVEAVLVHFDANLVSLMQILDVFWRLHDPTTLNAQGFDVGEQYRSGIYYFNEKQKEVVLQSLKAFETKKIFKNKIVTEVLPSKEFYMGEDYHQNYYGKKYGDRAGAGRICHTLREE